MSQIVESFEDGHVENAEACRKRLELSALWNEAQLFGTSDETETAYRWQLRWFWAYDLLHGKVALYLRQ